MLRRLKRVKSTGLIAAILIASLVEKFFRRDFRGVFAGKSRLGFPRTHSDG